MLGLFASLVIVCSVVGASDPNARLKRQSDRCGRCRDQEEFMKNFDRSDWMYSQREKLSSKKLVDVKMIGTHHSASYTISQMLDQYSVCQNTRIASQLKAGVRYIDLRVGAYLNKLAIGHAVHFGAPVEGILKEVVNFVKAHPKEFLIINLRDSDWTPIPPKQKFELINLVKSTFADLMVTSADSWFDLSSVTMGQIWENKRSVYVVYGDKLLWTVDTDAGRVNITQSQADSWGLRPIQSVYDPWPNTAKIDELFQKANAFYDRKQVPRKSFYVAQLLFSGAPFKTEGVDKMTAKLQQSGRIRQWLRDHPDYAIVYLDFFLGVGNGERQEMVGLLDEVIAANSK